jgi:flagellar biosynthetic protein FliR
VDPLPAIGHFLSLGGLTLLLIMGFHVKAAHFMIGSYKVLEFGQAVSPPIVAEWGIFQVSRAFALAFQLAAPFYLVSLIYNLTLGAINRAMPQLMVAFVGAPVITWGALTLLMLTSGVLLSIWQGQVDLFLGNPFRFTR